LAPGFGIGLCMGLYPPWRLMTVHGFEFFGYSPLWQPPAEGARLDWARLAVQWLVTALAATGLVFAPRRKGADARWGRAYASTASEHSGARDVSHPPYRRR
jgi:hypothetical protein